MLLAIVAVAAAAVCSDDYKDCLESGCCSSKTHGCFRRPNREFAQCRPLEEDCVDTPEWLCPQSWAPHGVANCAQRREPRDASSHISSHIDVETQPDSLPCTHGSRSQMGIALESACAARPPLDATSGAASSLRSAARCHRLGRRAPTPPTGAAPAGRRARRRVASAPRAAAATMRTTPASRGHTHTTRSAGRSSSASSAWTQTSGCVPGRRGAASALAPGRLALRSGKSASRVAGKRVRAHSRPGRRPSRGAPTADSAGRESAGRRSAGRSSADRDSADCDSADCGLC